MIYSVASRKLLATLIVGMIVSFIAAPGSVLAQDTPASVLNPPSGNETVLAQTTEPQIPVLISLPIGPQKIGRPVVVTAFLMNADGVAQSNKPIIMYVDGQQVRRDRTDEYGMTSISLGSDFSLGEHQLQIEFIGTEAYSSVTATTTFEVVPLKLTLETVPALANIPVNINGQVIQTDANGLAVVDVSAPGPINLEVAQNPNTNITENTRITFDRWSDEGFQPTRILDIQDDKHIQVGFNVSHSVTHTFVDLNGDPVDPSKAASLDVRSSTGDLITFVPGQERWLTATRIARRRTGLEATNVLYSIESVMIDGTNVVNRYQQRFLAQAGDTWEIQLLLYSATLSAADALFGFPVGRGISLEYPDGHIEPFTFGSNGNLHLESLPRGTYRIKVEGIQSLTGWTPIALSRNQTVQLQVFSVLDAGALLAVGVVIALILLFLGRPFLMKPQLILYRSIHRRSRSNQHASGLQAEDQTTLSESLNVSLFHSSVFETSPTSSTASNGKSSPLELNRRGSASILQISGTEGTNPKKVLLNIPLGRLFCIVNANGERQQLLADLVDRWYLERIRQSVPPSIVEREPDVRILNTNVMHKRSYSIVRLQRSELRTRSGLFAAICSIYADLPASSRHNYQPKDFDFNTRGAQCKNCDGKGQFADHVVAGHFVVCPVCQGSGYKESLLEIRLEGKNIADVLNMTVSEALEFLGDYPTVVKKLQWLRSLGFGDLVLGEPGMVLSTEAIRNIKKIRGCANRNLYVFNLSGATISEATAVRRVTALAEVIDRNRTIQFVVANTSTRVIENPVLMLSLGTDHRYGVGNQRHPTREDSSSLGKNLAR